MTLNHYVLNKNSSYIPLFVVHTTPLDSVYLKSSAENAEVSYPMVFIDLPGHGLSNYPEGYEFDIVDVAQKIDNLRRDLGYDKISVLGHGVGGFVAQEYATSFEKSCGSLIVVNSSPNHKYRETMAWNIREKYSKVTIQALDEYKGKTDEKSIRVRFTQSLATYFDPTSHEQAKSLMNSAETIATEAYVDLSKHILPKVDYRPQLRKLEIPVLVLASTKDVWPINSSQLFRNDIIHAKYDEFETGHFPMVEQTSHFWKRVVKFLETSVN